MPPDSSAMPPDSTAMPPDSAAMPKTPGPLDAPAPDRASAPRRWTRYFIERSPLPMLLIVGGGISISASYLMRDSLDVAAASLAGIGIVGLLVLMRMMDEIKDFEKDRVAHPERPLPRGLVSREALRHVMLVAMLVLLVYAGVLGVTRNAVAGSLYAITVAYSFLMYREFFVSTLLNRNQLVYAVSHQVILLPMYVFAVALVTPAEILSARSVWFALSGLGASFVYEVSRKLDPDALPVLRTYLKVHGRAAVVVAIVAALALLAVSSYRIGVELIVWPLAALMLVLLPLIYLRPRLFKLLEGTAALLMIVQMLAPTIHHAFGIFR
jgi:4-hydroxybenzoate polyprenyltransferase